MTRLLIGVPARNEADHIVDLADRLDVGARMLGGSYACELALAYQVSDDDTLERFARRTGTIPQVVLEAPGRLVGKGANVKLLVRHALEAGFDALLVVDADLGDYDPENLARVVSAARDGAALVLPLWCRPQGQGNTTNFLASPLLRAAYGAWIRQPIAGHMVLGRPLLERLDLDAVPDDYGVDITITATALASRARIAQVPLTAPAHPSKEGNSARVMMDVAAAVLRTVVEHPNIHRPDVAWPRGYWRDWDWPRNGGAQPDHLGVVAQQASSKSELARWIAVLDAGGDVATELWCDALAEAVRKARSHEAGLDEIVAELVCPFFVHAEHRRRRESTVAELERYVESLGLRLAARLHG